MNQLDDSAGEAFQVARSKLQTGPWNTGQLGEKGYVVSEVVNANDQSTRDGIKRYTDRYLQSKTIGRTIADFPFNPKFLPTELYKAAGISAEPRQQNGDAKRDQLSRVERLATLGVDEQSVDNENQKEEVAHDDAVEENAEDLEDEFEELDDDDYNAEKYFDDGDDYGDGDDGDNEAAY